MKDIDGPPFTITEDEPTPVVRDFDTFLDAVEAPSAYLTKAKRALDRATLHALNGLMRTHRTRTHARTDQERYPLLNMFQRICMSARLHVIDKVGGKLRMVPTAALAEFRKLTPAEKYVALLETLWSDCDWCEFIPHERTFGAALAAGYALALLDEAPVGRPVDPDALAREKRIHAEPRSHTLLHLLSFFGFIDCVAEPVTGRPSILAYKGQVHVSELTVTAFGSRFLRTLRTERPLWAWNVHDEMRFSAWPGRVELVEEVVCEGDEETGEDIEDEAEEELPPFFEAFVPLVAEGSLTRGMPRVAREPKKGTYVFRVSLGRIWRKIALSDEHTLDDLHLAIQEAFDFDNDHLYAFYMDTRRRSENCYSDPRGERPPYADDALLSQLDLFVGQSIRYLFDFGDCWEFDVSLLEIADRSHKGGPEILAGKGESPEQYPQWDEDDG